MSQSDQGNLASDIITYIGVPLAVLGVLPILYNTVATLAALSKVKRILRHSRMTHAALTRSDVVNRVIEVELPRYAVTPPDRFRERAEYWQLARQPSLIPGGTWTAFNWKARAIGARTQRLEYADQLRQPQVDVAFGELVAYLLDLGAVPDPRGWRLLRSTGLWAPTGCALMLGPDGESRALTVAPLDDSDGHLSLRVCWSQDWISRDSSHLPPYWVRLPPPTLPPLPLPLPLPLPPKEKSEVFHSKSDPGSSTASHNDDDDDDDGVPTADDIAAAEAGESKKIKKVASKESLDSIQKQGGRNRKTAITCRISVEGLVTALCEEAENEGTAAAAAAVANARYHYDPNNYDDNHRNLYIEHLRILRRGGSGGGDGAGVWFASAATAYGTSSQTVLWNYKIPDEILGFARRETVPCGVLVLLDIIEESETPEWGPPGFDDRAEQLERFVRRNREQQIAVQAENRMGPAERQIAASQRRQREMEQRMQDMRDQQRLDMQRRETRESQALQSPKWDTKKVAEHCLRWLHGQQQRQQQQQQEQQQNEQDQGQGHNLSQEQNSKSNGDDINININTLTGDFSHSTRDAAGALLYRMVLDGGFAAALCATLDLWKAWADNGGMRRSDLYALRERPALFAQAALLAAVVRDAAVADVATVGQGGTLAVDLQECLRMWRMVRLG